MNQTINTRLKNKETLIGQWVSLSDPAVVEALAHTGHDFLLLDGEHAPIGESELPNLLRAAKGGSAKCIYRVRENSENRIKMGLDLGVDGIMVPRVSNAAEAQQAVNAAKYPPLGKRGIGPLRASNYYQNFAEYVATANETTTLILQIEDVAAIDHLDDVLAVKGVDALYIGPADLSASMGLFGQQGHPDFVAAVETIRAKCAASDMPLGFDTRDVNHLAELSGQGFQVLTLGSDIAYLISGAKSLAADIREALGSL
ncbi:MAG: HpcH/HpaI aldolase/citrate lyase family protein [Anaerolineae bacterium]